MKLISVVTACYNEEENITEVYRRVKEVMEGFPDYRYEHLFIDNASTDRTVDILRDIAAKDVNVKVIVNSRNFGHIRSPFHGLLQATGDAVISIVADLQDPPAMIADFIKKWEEGYKIVVGVKKQSRESRWMFWIRKLFYCVIGKLSEIRQIPNFTGFGLYDRHVMDILRQMEDPYPYFRGLICEIGYDIAEIEYTQPVREKGRTKNSFYALFDMALLGITNHSKVPLRIASMFGFIVSIISAFLGFIYFLYKLAFWDRFTLGLAPLIIGLFFFASVQLFFIGVIGEYIGSIHTQVKKRPLVIEKERINF